MVRHINQHFLAACLHRLATVCARLVGYACICSRVKALALGSGSHLKVAVRPCACGVAGLADNRQHIAGLDFCPFVDKQLRAVCKIQIVHCIRGLVCVQLHADIIAPFPCLVALVRHDAGCNNSSCNALAVVAGHADFVVIHTANINAAVPGLAAAARVTVAAVRVLHEISSAKNHGITSYHSSVVFSAPSTSGTSGVSATSSALSLASTAS